MKPVLLLIPGMFNTTAVWDPVRAAFGDAADIRVADVTTQSTLAEMAHDAWRLVADLPAATPLVVAGFSMGGYVLIELLARHRERVQGVAFIDSSARVETAESLAGREKTIAALERSFDRAVAAVIPFSLHPAHHGRAELVESMRAMMTDVGAATAIRQTRAIMARADHHAMLAQLRVPALVACGREDKVTPPALSEDLAATIPGAKMLWLEHAGHQSPLEQPAELAAALRHLLADALDHQANHAQTAHHHKETRS